MTEVKLIEKEKGSMISFMIKDTTPANANALRRAIISEVPVMAINDVEFRRNSSLLYDEIIAHRLGLIPLTTDIKSYNLPSKCNCEAKGCARCQVKLTLKAKGPEIVYASELKSDDPAIKPVYPKMPIVKLLKNQFLELEATATLGQGMVHTKWSPGTVHYKQRPIIEIKETKEPCHKCEQCVEECPVDVFEFKNNKLSIIKENYLKCTLCEACMDTCPEHVTVTPTNDYIFYVESFGQLDSRAMVVEAAKVIQERLDEFLEALKNSKE